MDYLPVVGPNLCWTSPSCLPGDKVVVRWRDYWLPGRVLGTAEYGTITYRRRCAPAGEPAAADMKLALAEEPTKEMARVSFSLPYCIPVTGGRRLAPGGTPVIRTFQPSQIQLIERDPDWDPYYVKPFLAPHEFVVGKASAYEHKLIEAYVPPSWYSWGDRVWVWDQSWRPAEVGNPDDRWVRARRVVHGDASARISPKAYRPYEVWPVLCEHSAPRRMLTVDSRHINIESIRQSKNLVDVAFSRLPQRLRPNRSGS